MTSSAQQQLKRKCFLICVLDPYITSRTDAVAGAMWVGSRYRAEITAVSFLHRKQQSAAINEPGTAECFSRWVLHAE